MKAFIFRFLFVLIGLFIGLLLAEGLLRLINFTNIIHIDPKKSFANDPFIYSPTLKYSIKPYLTRECTAPGNPKATCHANKYGHRDKDHEFTKPNSTYRILLLGDSLTYGPGVNGDETYPAIFEKLLVNKASKDRTYEVINMGMIFYGPEQYYNLYNELGKKYNPDLIVLSFHLLTDPYDAYEFDTNRRFYQLKALPETLPHTVNQPLKENSYLWRTLLSAYYSWANDQDAFVFDKVFKGQKNRFQYDTQLSLNEPFMQKGWALSEHFVSKIVNEAKNNGTEIVIIGFPIPAQVDPEAWKQMKKNGLLADKQLYESSAARKKFQYMCDKNSWQCIELRDELRKAQEPSKLFLKDDIHYTKEGNTITANTIYNFLSKKKLVN